MVQSPLSQVLPHPRLSSPAAHLDPSRSTGASLACRVSNELTRTSKSRSSYPPTYSNTPPRARVSHSFSLPSSRFSPYCIILTSSSSERADEVAAGDSPQAGAGSWNCGSQLPHQLRHGN
eukprot:755398-Hanusia_phi.AAC.1